MIWFLVIFWFLKYLVFPLTVLGILIWIVRRIWKWVRSV